MPLVCILSALLWPGFEVAELFDLAITSVFEDVCELVLVLGVVSDIAGTVHGCDWSSGRDGGSISALDRLGLRLLSMELPAVKGEGNTLLLNCVIITGAVD